ncbi:MFS transporter [Paracandidimonas soli]|nr:MFS transporter [Paracandidimonas soli]
MTAPAGNTASQQSSSTHMPQAGGFEGLSPGNAEYRQAGLALFLVGFSSFALIYCVQPLLPAFAASFNVSPASSSLALSLTTGLLAISIVLAGAFSQALGRRGMIFGSMLMAAVLNIIASLLPSWHGLLAARALEGLVLGGVPAISMAWLAEEIHPSHLGRSMGLYVAGTAFGGMAGRVGMGLVAEITSWRIAMFLLGIMCLACAIAFWKLLPPSRNFILRPGFSLEFHLRAWKQHLRNRGLLRIYAIGFLIMSVFVALFNYATFLLSGAPYHFSQTVISLIFLVYGFGVVSSSVAGTLADRYGRRRLLMAGLALMLGGVLLTLLGPWPAIVGGIAVLTTGFFIAHAVASSAVGPQAGGNKGHAASLYLLFYYLGSSIIGSAGGWVWEHGGWVAVVAMTAALTMLGMLLALKTRDTRAPA